MNNMLNLIDQIQEETRDRRLSTAFAVYKEMKVEIINQITIKIEQAIIDAMMEGKAYTNVDLTQPEFSHEEEIKLYFEAKGFKIYCDRYYNEFDKKAYFVHIEWGSRELNI